MNLTGYLKSLKNNFATIILIPVYFVLAVCFSTIAAIAQEPEIEVADSLSVIDSANTEKTAKATLIGKKSQALGDWFGKSWNNLSESYPNPKTAAYFALVFPGGGQLYNKDFWKVPIVWGGYGLIGYSIYFNTQQYRGLKQAVLDRLNQVPDQYPFIPTIQALRLNRDAYRKDLELAYIGLFAVHVLSAIEAYVACHLKTFDISDDLSLKIKPGINQIALGSATASIVPSIGLTIQYK
jgi:hypothetical protein